MSKDSGRKIDVMVVGAQKAGSTSLIKYFSEHPQVLSHPQTEFAYFRSDSEYAEGYHAVFARYFTKGSMNAPIVAGKNAAIYTSELAIQRLQAHNPKCKIIFILRNPVSRAISSYNMDLFNGWTSAPLSSLEDILRSGDDQSDLYNRYIVPGFYADQLGMLRKYFPDDQIKPLLFDTLKSSPKEVVQNLWNWAGIDATIEPRTSINHNPTRKPRSKVASSLLTSLRRDSNLIKRLAKKVLPYKTFSRIGEYLLESNKSNIRPDAPSDSLIALLNAHYSPQIKRLEEETDLDISHWNSTSDPS